MRVVNAPPRVISRKVAGLECSLEDESEASPFKGLPAFILNCRGVDEGDVSEFFPGGWGSLVSANRYGKDDNALLKSHHGGAAREERELAGILDDGVTIGCDEAMRELRPPTPKDQAKKSIKIASNHIVFQPKFNGADSIYCMCMNSKLGVCMSNLVVVGGG